MLEQYIRQPYQRALVDPIAALLPTLNPNAISLAAGLLAPVIVWSLLSGHPLIAVSVLLLSGYLDTLDGTLARRQDSASPVGTVLDIVMDRVVEFAVVLGLLLLAPQTRAVAALWMLGSILLCVTSFLVVGMFSDNDSDKSFHYSPGIMERPEAFTLFIAMMLLPQYFTALALTFTALTLLTTVIRVVEFVKIN